MTEHKSDCTTTHYYAPCCTCNADKPTPPAPTAEQVREAKRYILHLHNPRRDADGNYYVRDLRHAQMVEDEEGPYVLYSDYAAILAALDKAQESAAEAAAGAHAEQEVSREALQERDALRADLAKARGEVEDAEEERKAGWQLAGDAAHGLRVECDGDLGHEAEQIRAERDALRAELAELRGLDKK